ncbi:asparagine synthase (glutamine-hydrolyzing) [Sporosalibacterium faouarense]|uniref:asparagine synthase (glutamine-hydrolyzing) n=1 Tax=Sporosalibacterium faouarense TaxID=516123 RepID=UPI00141CAC4D|nr:asparagine synthase (glutamine-hydrolyzing) [Sporosalibacterium faouarense]MTI49070.1 asparagine synthase (glutamine-hydrolyzing) [Bacillota bacterium]
MCGIAGWINYHENIVDRKMIIEEMTKTLSNRGPDDYGYYLNKNALLGHRRLTVVDPEGGKQPMAKKVHDKRYVIVYNGELYNTEDVRHELIEKGYSFESYSDTEVLLTSYIEWKEKCLDHINGIYAFGIWDEENKTLFLSRDRLGVKPLFYSIKNDSIIFGSEIKTLLAHPYIDTTVNENGLLELFGLGPARSLGNGVFKDIEEIPPAHYLVYSPNGIKMKEYWKLEAKPHDQSLRSTIEETRSLVIDAIERQLVSDVPVCTFLSGGLDSSAISAIASESFKKDGRGVLNTYSIDYKDNDKFFKANEFQPNSDSFWVGKMSKYIGSKHHGIELDNRDLALALYDSVLARDLPGMADIDSSLYLFCKEIRKEAVVGLSGECADEIFGGYPWYTREEDIKANTFPWSKSINERKNILSNRLKTLPLSDYVGDKYEETINRVPKLKNESPREKRMRELFYLNIKWFMITLLNRKDRMSMANSLEVRVPFADHRIVEYGFNIPMNMKFCDSREKGLLRRALKGILPDEIIERKKSPYPKTHNPEYTRIVQKWMTKILEDKNAPVHQLIDTETVKQIVRTGGESYKKPWFGQLMTGPQLIAYLIQLNIWLEEYNVKIEI